MILLIPIYIITSYLFGVEYFVILCVTTLFGGVYEHLAYYMATFLDGKTKHRPFGTPTKKILDNPIMIGAPLYTIGHYIVIYIHYFVGVYIDNILFNFVFYGGVLTLFEYVAGKCLGAGSKTYNSIELKNSVEPKNNSIEPKNNSIEPKNNNIEPKNNNIDHETIQRVTLLTNPNEKIITSVWDYSDEPYNVEGIISLRHYIIWALCSLFSLWAHPIIINFMRIRRC